MLTAASAVGWQQLLPAVIAPAVNLLLPFRSEIFTPTRTAQGNEQGNEQVGKHKNKPKLKLKHNNKRKELTRADRLHKSKRRQHVFFSMQARIGSRSAFTCNSKQLKISDAARSEEIECGTYLPPVPCLQACR
jgi:hypothetical protein